MPTHYVVGRCKLALPCFEVTWSCAHTYYSASTELISSIEEQVVSCIPMLLDKFLWRSYS